MEIFKIRETGYDTAILGFSLSYKSTLERAEEILPKYAFGVPGESKFLESITVELDILAPRYFWQEFDTYRVGMTKQSESTMHRLYKDGIREDSFQYSIPSDILRAIIDYMEFIKNDKCIFSKSEKLALMKNILPEGFLQRRIVVTNYKCLQNIYHQRHDHPLPQWGEFCRFLLENLDHPEFIDKEYVKCQQKSF